MLNSISLDFAFALFQLQVIIIQQQFEIIMLTN